METAVVHVFKTATHYILLPIGHASTGLGLGVAPVPVVPTDQPLADSLSRAFQTSLSVVPAHPTDWSSYVPVTNHIPEYQRGKRRPSRFWACAVSRSSERYELVPMFRLTRSAYGFQQERSVSFPPDTPIEVVTTELVATLERAPALT